MESEQFHNIKVEQEDEYSKQETSMLDFGSVFIKEEVNIKVEPLEEEEINITPEQIYEPTELTVENFKIKDEPLDYIATDPLDISDVNQFTEGKN